MIDINHKFLEPRPMIKRIIYTPLSAKRLQYLITNHQHMSMNKAVVCGESERCSRWGGKYQDTKPQCCRGCKRYEVVVKELKR